MKKDNNLTSAGTDDEDFRRHLAQAQSEFISDYLYSTQGKENGLTPNVAQEQLRRQIFNNVKEIIIFAYLTAGFEGEYPQFDNIDLYFDSNSGFYELEHSKL